MYQFGGVLTVESSIAGFIVTGSLAFTSFAFASPPARGIALKRDELSIKTSTPLHPSGKKYRMLALTDGSSLKSRTKDAFLRGQLKANDQEYQIISVLLPLAACFRINRYHILIRHNSVAMGVLLGRNERKK